MKFKLTKSNAYKLLAVLVSIGAVMVGLHYILREIFFASRARDITIPAQTITVANPLLTTIYFNNIIGATGAVAQFEKSIDSAQHSIEIAVFSIKSDRLRQALYRADARGVKVTLILDSSRADQHNKAFPDLPKGIVRIDDGTYDAVNSKNTAYMHHKFMLIDRGYPTQELTQGSLNFTDLGEKYNESYFLTTSDATLIKIYGGEFDLLKKGVTSLGKLGNAEYDPWTARIQYPNGFLEVWMSPGFSNDSAKYRILELINSATTSLDLMMWDFTDTKIAQALVKKSEAGVHVRIVADNTNATSSYSVLPTLMKAKEKEGLKNLEVILDTKSTALITGPVPDGFNPYLHEHSMIVDGKIAVFGTNNWSMWGFYHNDEDTLITDNTYLVGQFEKTFDYFYTTLK